MLKSQCPAYQKTCHSCGEKKHFSPCCPKSKRSASKVNALSLEDKGHLEGAAAVDSQIYQVNEGDSRQHNPHAIYADMVVGGKAVKFQLDSGAACNVLPLSALPQGTSLQTSGKVLKTYNGATLATQGTAEVTLINPVTQQHHCVPFEVLRGHHMPLLGVKAAQDLDLLTVNNNNFKRIASVSAQPIPSTKHAILENYATVLQILWALYQILYT